MHKRHWLHTVLALAVIQGLSLSAYAQDGVALPVTHETSTVAASTSRYNAMRGRMGFQGQLDKAVGLTPEQRDAVRGLLAQQHKDRLAMQEQTDAKIRSLLSPEQQKKFDAFLAQQKQSRNSARRRNS